MLGEEGDRIRIKRDDDCAIEFNNTSMTDVIFILLIFFVSLSQVRTSSLDVELPVVKTDGGGAAEERKPVVIELAADDSVWLEGEKVDPETVGVALALRRAAEQAEPRIRIRGDAGSKHGTMIRVIAALADAGLTRIEFAVRSAPPEALH